MFNSNYRTKSEKFNPAAAFITKYFNSDFPDDTPQKWVNLVILTTIQYTLVKNPAFSFPSILTVITNKTKLGPQ